MKPLFSSLAALLTILAIAALFVAHTKKVGRGSATSWGAGGSSEVIAREKTRLAENYGKLPLSFEVNQDQTDRRVKFFSRGKGYSLFLTGDEAVLTLKRVSQTPPHNSSLVTTPKRTQRKTANALKTTDNVLRMKLAGANVDAKVTGTNELPGKSNYFIGNDPKKWRTNVPTYAKVKYQNVYPGVDLVYYGNQGGELEYDFVVAPGGDPSSI